MSLSWDVREVTGRDEWTEIESTKCTAIIYATMVIGMGDITPKNAEEFWCRIDMYQRVAGALIGSANDDIMLTPADIRRVIGLRTNVGGETSAWFRRRMAEISADRSTREWRLSEPATKQESQIRDAQARALAKRQTSE